MNIEEYVNKIKILEDENMQLKNKLKTYTAPTRNTKYYETHKEDIIQKTKNKFIKIYKEWLQRNPRQYFYF